MSERLALKEALPAVFKNFQDTAASSPERLLITESARLSGEGGESSADPFGTLVTTARELFLSCANSYIFDQRAQEKDIDPEQAIKLMRKMETGRLGIGLVVLFSEIVPLVRMRDARKVPTPAEAAATLDNSYGFIDRIIKGGGQIGKLVASEYLSPIQKEEAERNAEEGKTPWDFPGTVVNGDLVRPQRLQNFSLNPEEDQVEPVGLDDLIARITLPSQPGRCPADVIEDIDAQAVITRGLFDVIADHVQEHIYPDYLPMAAELMVPASS